VFATIDQMKLAARRAGEDIIDLGMGNPDMPTPAPIVAKLVEAAQKGQNHRYSASRGITKLRLGISNWYKRRYGVDIDPETEAIATIGSKEGLAHLVLATVGPGDVVFVPNPTYPIHSYSVVIAGGDVRSIPLSADNDFFEELVQATRETWPHPKMLIISFPHNPTAATVDHSFFERIVEFAREHNVIVIHDFAYADLTFDGYKAPSFLETPGAKEVGVEFFTMSKSYNMPGWRVGFAVGNKDIIFALRRMKSYLDYGMFQPIQIASIIGLNECDNYVPQIVDRYRLRRDVLVEGLNRIGWEVPKPKATMFVWARIPEQYRHMGSVEFSKLLLTRGKVAVSPGLGFGAYGDEYVRLALVENKHRIRQAIRGIKGVMEHSEVGIAT